MADKAPLWERIVGQYDLQRIPFHQMASWEYGNMILALERDVISSTIKIQRAGFGDCIDSEGCLFEMLDEMRAQKLIPDSSAEAGPVSHLAVAMRSLAQDCLLLK